MPRNRIATTLHFEHVAGGVLPTDLQGICSSLIALYQARYGNAAAEVLCKAYDVDAVPNYPRAQAIVNSGVAWNCSLPREIALCLSYSAANAGDKSTRGRMYLAPYLKSGVSSLGLRPSAAQLDWALEWYTKPNESLPDIGGVDWKFGVWSKSYNKFTQTTKAWVNDDWDVQRRRGLRENTRVSAAREG
jgi:hypothetical protein